MSNIGFFGGTFNPPHLAHKRLALEMKEEAHLDKILVVPTFVPPHKAALSLASGEDRLTMCRLMFDEDIFSVSDMELRRKGKSYSFDTLTEMKRLYPDDKLFMIIGSDMLLSFHEWYRYRDILGLVTLCAASRDGKEGVYFAVWAPHAESVSVVGDFNSWNSKKNPMKPLETSGIYEVFIPDLKPGTIYKFAIT
ncbi:MAG: nicotinate (nicotinamide) nucleotide adenylyltransferase, partial [Acutalibacteraceae bacterium]